MVSLPASDTVVTPFLPSSAPKHQMKRCAHFRARLHPRTTLAKLRKSWNGCREVSVVQGLRGDTRDTVSAVTAVISIWHLAFGIWQMQSAGRFYERLSRFASLE